MNAETPVDRLDRAVEATGAIVTGIGSDQWSEPTPCPGWSVRTLLNHLVVGNRLFAGTLRGEEPPSPDALARLRGVDALGDDPVHAYRESSAQLLDAFRQPGILERVVEVPAGRFPGIGALHLRITETLVHGWDLARATGQPTRLPEDLAEEELMFSRQRAGGVARTGDPFGPEQPVPEGASAIERLAAFLGRAVESGGAASELA